MMPPVGKVVRGFCCGLLVASGFLAALALTQKTSAAVQADSFDLKPSWAHVTVRVDAGALLIATLEPTTAKRCIITIRRRAGGSSAHWTLQTDGMPLRLMVRTNRNAGAGDWPVRADCVQRDSRRLLSARLTVHVFRGGTAGDLLAPHDSFRVSVLKPHAQAFVGSTAEPPVKVAIVRVPYGKGSSAGDGYPLRWKDAARDSVLDDWGNYNRECTSFVAWALAVRNGFKVPFRANASAWPAISRAHGYKVDRKPAPGSVAYWGVGPGHVAYVRAVIGGDVRVEEYSWFGHDGRFDSRTVPASAFTFFIHFKDLASPPPTGTMPGTTASTPTTGGAPHGGTTTSGTTTFGTTTTAATTTTSPETTPIPPSGTGGSTAVCSPSPCTQGTSSTNTIVVDDGAGKSVTRTYYVYRPNGLTDSPGNVAPLLVSFDGIPNGDPGSWQAEANAMRFVVVYIPNVHQPCTSGCQYATPFVAPDPTIGANDCGVSSNQRCDDAPWVKAVLNRIVCSGAPPCENIDPNKLFASGASKGGTMTTDMMCDPSTVGYFRGFAVVSIQIISPATDGSKTLPTQCRSLQTGPRGFSSIWIYGDSDRFSVTGGCENNPPPEGCLGSGFVDAKGRWNFGQFENATLLWDPVLGCSQAPSVAMFGSPSAANFRDVYAPCSSSNRALAVTRVHNGGHAQPALDDDLNGATNTNGFKTAVEAWTFLASH